MLVLLLPLLRKERESDEGGIMSSPRMKDKQLKKKFGMRAVGQSFDQPCELGYQCPKGHIGEDLSWSEFNEHIWCPRCKKDYHYAKDCKLKRMCWMKEHQWLDFLSGLPMKPSIIKGIQHFGDCKPDCGAVNGRNKKG